MMKITELMEQNIYTCRPEDSLEETAATMLKRDIGALPVVDSENKLLGMITDRDICMSSLIEGRPLSELPVSLAASTPAWACGLEDSLSDVHAIMQTHKVHRIPVVDKEEKLVRIIGLGDLVRATTAKKSGTKASDLIQTLAAIMEPREDTTPLQATSPAKGKSPG